MSAVLSVPIPMLMPMLVDEVRLDKPGKIVSFLTATLPADCHGPVVFIFTVMLVTMVLRFASLMLAVLQTILGLYPAKSGELYFGGVNIRDIGLDVVRENSLKCN